jgi:hypothetical protein
LRVHQYLNPELNTKRESQQTSADKVYQTQESAHENHNDYHDHGQLNGFLAGGPGYFSQLTSGLIDIALNSVLLFYFLSQSQSPSLKPT